MAKLRGFWTAVVFILGCAVGGAAGRLVVPPASAQQLATLTRWEYFCFDRQLDAGEVSKEADSAGGQGWEMVTVGPGAASTGPVWCFKRPKR